MIDQSVLIKKHDRGVICQDKTADQRGELRIIRLFFVALSADKSLKHKKHMTQQELKTKRINVVDSLRGFAVVGIILLHFLEHLNFYSFPELTPFDEGLWDTMFYLCGSKMYAIFALLFGLSCYIQHNNREQRGEDFRLRFAWRMLLLFGWGLLDLMFFNGDILCTYAALGLLLIPLVKAQDAVLAVLAFILFLQPIEVYNICHGLIDSNAQPIDLGVGECFDKVFTPCAEGGFWDVAIANLRYGLQINFGWAIEHGRFTQTLMLFIVGMLLGRKRLFLNEGSNLRFWKNVIIRFSLPMFVFMQLLLNTTNFGEMQICVGQGLETLLAAWKNVAMASFYVAGITILYYTTSLRKSIEHLSYIGKMSLTNYLLQSIVGGFLFYNWGLGLHTVCGHTYSFCLGVIVCICLYFFCRMWCKHFRRGPLEELWAKATNIKMQ